MDQLQQQFIAWLQAVLTPMGAYQLSVIVLALALAFFINRRWHTFVTQRLGASERTGIRRFALRSTERVVFPLLMLLFVVIGRGVLTQFGIDTRLLNVFVPLLSSLAIIRFIVFALRRAYGPSPTLKAMEGIIAGVIWVGVALYLLGWMGDVLSALDSVSMKLGDTRISLLSTFKFILTAAVFVVAARWVSQWIENKARKATMLSATMKVGVAKFSRVMLYTIALLIALDAVGIDLTTLAVFGGALGVGLGFGLQRIASNFISGFILLFDRSIKPGDVISIKEKFGWVVALHARYIVVRDRDGVETLIPNEVLITSEVTNWSYSDRNVRIKLPVQVSYHDDPVKAMALMEKACEVSDRILQDPPPQARLLGFGDNGIELELRVWIIDPETGIGNVRSDVNVAIWQAFRDNGITIPFPQRDVHLISTPMSAEIKSTS